MGSVILLRMIKVPERFDKVFFKNSLNIVEEFDNVRSSSGTSARANGIEFTVRNLRDAFQADYNFGGSGPYLVELVSTHSLRISINVENFFTSSDFSTQASAGTNFLASFTNEPDTINLAVSSVNFFSADSDFCNKIDASITTSEQIDDYSIDGGSTYVSVNSNPFLIKNITRISGTLLRIRKGSELFNYRIKEPSVLLKANISATYTNSPQGATVTVLTVGSNFLLTYTYSLDGVTFQSSNTFPGILQGDYTFYVKDQFGCQVNKSITIPAFIDGGVGQRIPYSDLPSKSLSIRYFKYIDFSNSTEYKNDENTQSNQLPYTQNARLYNQLFKNSDTVITTQLKTNYENVVATVVDEELIEHDIEVVKVVNYSNLKDRRDAIIYPIDNANNQVGLYFNGVDNIYDYFSGAITGNVDLNGALPLWGLVGNFVFVNNAWFEISNVIFDESVSSYVIVITTTYVGLPSVVEVSSIYNLEPYNIHEFNIDFSLFTNQKVQVNITQTDTNTSFPEVVYLSEIIEVAESYSDTLFMEYYNDKNTDIFYATGIKNKIHIPIEFFSGGILGETTTERTDINTFLIDAEGYENDLIAFKLMPKQMMRKVIQGLSHKFVFLNGVQYVKEESPEVVPVIGTNLYRVNAEMTKSNAVYTSRGLVGDISLTPLEIPNLLRTSSGGFLKIKK
tara:strand:- start:3065 stop:5098 length:2034 start_codon:yes stop_codon:yes gene_type:complete